MSAPPRNYPNFLDAYLEYAKDGWCPEKFHYWTGVSIIAAALERKVTINWKHEDRWIFPNLFIFLLAAPGVGKSTALDRGVNLLRKVKYREVGINLLPQKMSEAALLDAMEQTKHFDLAGYPETQMAGYYVASEASACMQSICSTGGELQSMLTELYDCSRLFRKQTKTAGQNELVHVCLNIIAGCTFSFLGKLLPKAEVHGGFASRITFIVQNEVLVRHPKWDETPRPSSAKLVEDLQRIHNLSGFFEASPEFKARFESFHPANDEKVKAMASEHRQAFLARKGVNILKLAMIFAVAESDSLVLTEAHWDKAEATVASLEDSLPSIMSKALSQEGQDSINRFILNLFVDGNTDSVAFGELRAKVLMKGFRPTDIEATLTTMTRSHLLQLVAVPKPAYKILVNPKDYL